MSDPHAITSHEQLRALIAEAKAKTKTKVVTHLGESSATSERTT